MIHWVPRDQGCVRFGAEVCDNCWMVFDRAGGWYHKGISVILDDCLNGKQSVGCPCGACCFQQGTGQKHSACLCGLCWAVLLAGSSLPLYALEGVASAAARDGPSVREILEASGEPYTPKRR